MDIASAKRNAGYRAVDENMDPSFKYVGVGSGSTVVYCVERLVQLGKQNVLPVNSMFFIPTGYQSKRLILEGGLPLMEIDQFASKEIDIVFDGADELDSDLNCIKGGGACLFQEKLVGTCSKRFICVADSSKISQKLGEKWVQGVPIEVVPLACQKITLDLKLLGAVSVVLRQGGKAKAGPVVTDNGNFVLDASFGVIDPKQVKYLDGQIKLLTGVLETGLFENCYSVYVGEPNGDVRVIHRTSEPQ